MKSLTAVRKKSPNYPVEFKIKMVELSHRPEISVAQLAREHGINDNLLFKWRQYWREGKLRPPSTTENNVPELLPITLDTEDVVPATSPRSQPVAAAAPESLNISCEVTFRHGYGSSNVDPITIRDKDLAGRWHHRYEKRLQRPGGKGADDAERRSDVRSRFYLPWA
ncbi:transposase [Pseudomonas sp.]|nr:transposase [Pseudomonas sp.]MDU4256183.1 transposase [Pseudomonas sp.]